jgi:hypothetical protein
LVILIIFGYSFSLIFDQQQQPLTRGQPDAWRQQE